MPVSVGSRLVLVATIAWQQVLQVGPYVAAGVLLAAVLGQIRLPLCRWHWARRGGLFTILSAAWLGSALPISSHAAVPLLLQLLREGALPGPLLAFLVASSMLNPQLFLLILGGLGPRLALAHVLSVLVLGGLAGVAASYLPPALLLRPTPLALPCDSASPRGPAWHRLAIDLLDLFAWVGLTFVLGAILTAALQVWVPANWIDALLGRNQLASAVAAALLGIPLYSCAGTAVPILASLIENGLSRVAVLAFLLVGPAMRARSLAAVGSLLNRRALAVYACGVIAGAIALSLLLVPSM